MIKHYYFLLLFSLFSISIFSQTLQGLITDAETGEELIGVNIISSAEGTVSEYDGTYILNLSQGEYDIVFSYVGYETQTQKVNITSGENRLNIKMKGGRILKEVQVVADMAIERKTPIAFSNIPTLKLQEELAAQDIPMILNSTPGAYATSAGGGDGDARITIRGFNQRNVAVMLDGIPVNDMENGWVYWSNWFGLDLVTQTMQVQRGLGASKLAIPSVGGTINILTKGIDAKPGLRFRQEVGNDGYLRSTFGLTSGRINGWGVSLAGSYKQGDGWVDGAFTKGFFYYLRVDRQMGKHLISFSGFGAPQEHGQRPFTKAIATYSAEKARELDIPEANIEALDFLKDRGLRFNEFEAVYDGGYLNTRQNYYHKPQFSLRHSVQANDKLFISNVAYLSIGDGGGVRLFGYDPLVSEGENYGRIDLDKVYAVNSAPNFAKPDTRSEGILRSSVNNHFWYGLLSTLKYDISSNLTFSGGVDLRYYEGKHHREVRDLLGGTYYRDLENTNKRIDPNTQLLVGDKFGYDNLGKVRWGGLFGLLEYEKDKWSVFSNLSFSYVSYSLEDYMKAKVITLDGETLEVAYNVADDGDDPDGPLIHNGTIYTVDNPSPSTVQFANDNGLTLDSESAQNQTIDWTGYPGFTFKSGAAYNFREDMGVFINAGYLSKAQRYINVIRDNRNSEDARPKLFGEVENEKVWAVELGYNYKSSFFSANVNTYYTYWDNKPLDSPVFDVDPDDPEEQIPVNVNGIAARHMGIELDFAIKPTRQVTIEGLASWGDWIWASNASWVSDITSESRNFYSDGVHVGDAAQLQFGGLIRFEPIRGFYIKQKVTFFGKNFSNFSPESLESIANAGRESWQLPNYLVASFHTGYNFKIQKTRMSIRFNILNLFDNEFISDANNNDRFGNVPNQVNGFNAQSASVHFGQGRRWSTGLTISF